MCTDESHAAQEPHYMQMVELMPLNKVRHERMRATWLRLKGMTLEQGVAVHCGALHLDQGLLGACAPCSSVGGLTLCSVEQALACPNSNLSAKSCSTLCVAHQYANDCAMLMLMLQNANGCIQEDMLHEWVLT